MNELSICPIVWQDDHLQLLDQRLLPAQESHFVCHNLNDVIYAIREMVVRGAPAIGITAAYGVVLAAHESFKSDPTAWQALIQPKLEALAQARPTAVNLNWAIAEMQKIIDQHGAGDPAASLIQRAQEIHQQDIAANMAMGDIGAALLQGQSAVLTHCNAGALATGGYGTALGVIRSAWKQGKLTEVYADETRPWLQGARLTAWEMVKEGIPVSLIADSTAAYLMSQGKISWLIVGSDRIAANGDVANKIGTYSAAIAAKYHGVKVMVVAPTSTVDMSLANGNDIPIETRDESEIIKIGGQQIAPNGAHGWNPVFDITPASLVDAIVTEKGVVLHPTAEKMAAMMSQ